MNTANNSFDSVLHNQRKGAMHTEISEKLQELTQSVIAIGKGGSLTLTIKVSPANGDCSAMTVVDEVTLKKPQPTRANSIFYTTDDGRLVRQDPNQKEMELEVVKPVPATPEVIAKTNVG